MKKTGHFKTILKIISGILGIALVIGVFVFLYFKGQPKETVYEIVQVDEGNIENTTVATGNVSPRDEVLIKPQISGIILEILKEAGQSIKAGEIIATIQVIPEASSLNSAESQLNLANISLNLAKSEFERQQELFEKGAIAKEEMEKSDADYKKAVEEVSNAKDNLDIIKTGVSKKTAQFSNTQIRSTIDGMILDIPVKVGNSVILSNNFNDGTTIATIANMNDMIFIGKVDETEVGRIHTGMPMKLSIGAIENKKFNATLEYIAPKGVEENGATLFEIKAAAQISDSIDIRAGYSSNAEIILADAKNVLIIPESSITFRNDSSFVYVVKEEDPKQVFEEKYVTIGLSDGISIQIKSGLKKDERIRGNVVSNDKENKNQ